MNTKSALRNMIRKLLKLGYIVQAKELMKTLEVSPKSREFINKKVVSLEQYRKFIKDNNEDWIW